MNAVGTVAFAIPGEVGKLGNGYQSNEGAIDAADTTEKRELHLSKTNRWFSVRYHHRVDFMLIAKH